jgi:hypothetical protein
VESRWACLTDFKQSIGEVHQEDPHKHLEINGALEAIICTFLMCIWLVIILGDKSLVAWTQTWYTEIKCDCD